MQNKNISFSPAKYIGIPYVFGQSDCISLLRSIYSDLGYSETFNDGKPITHNWFETDPYRFYRYLAKHFKKTYNYNNLPLASIILFEINGESHVGITVDNYGRFISTDPSELKLYGGQSFIDRIDYFKNDPKVKLICAFVRKEESNEDNSKNR